MNDGDALVLFSGGQDSSTCLLWALAQPEFSLVHVVSFDYGQRHAVELEQAAMFLAEAEARTGRDIIRHRLTIPSLSDLGGAALTDPSVEVEALASAGNGNAYAAARALPSTFVPGRNTILIGTAAALAAKLDAPHLVTGICAMDRAGYPDCRAEYASALQTALQLGLDWPRLTILAPLLWRSKADTWRLAEAVAGAWGVQTIRSLSHTCYQGDRSKRLDSGFGCGECPACITREEGYREYFLGSPLVAQ